MNIMGYNLDNDYWNFTPFQVHVARQIENHKLFKSFMMPDLESIETINSKLGITRPVEGYVIMWVDVNDVAHTWVIEEAKIGQKIAHSAHHLYNEEHNQ